MKPLLYQPIKLIFSIRLLAFFFLEIFCIKFDSKIYEEQKKLCPKIVFNE